MYDLGFKAEIPKYDMVGGKTHLDVELGENEIYRCLHYVHVLLDDKVISKREWTLSGFVSSSLKPTR